MFRRTFDANGYSPLEKIHTRNVKRLAPAWSFATGLREGHQAPPIVNDGVMFITTPHNHVIALDARTGEQLWRYERELPEDLMQLHPTNRGVALWGERVYMATADAFLVALDARTGAVVWEQQIEDYAHGYYCTLAPLAVRGKILVGVSGGELGIRGYCHLHPIITDTTKKAQGGYPYTIEKAEGLKKVVNTVFGNRWLRKLFV